MHFRRELGNVVNMRFLRPFGVLMKILKSSKMGPYLVLILLKSTLFFSHGKVVDLKSSKQDSIYGSTDSFPFLRNPVNLGTVSWISVNSWQYTFKVRLWVNWQKGTTDHPELIFVTTASTGGGVLFQAGILFVREYQRKSIYFFGIKYGCIQKMTNMSYDIMRELN